MRKRVAKRPGGEQFGSRFWVVMAAATLILIAASVAGCGRKEARVPQPRPVPTDTIEAPAEGETVSFTGQIFAKDQVNLAFRSRPASSRRSHRPARCRRPQTLSPRSTWGVAQTQAWREQR